MTTLTEPLAGRLREGSWRVITCFRPTAVVNQIGHGNPFTSHFGRK
jgi:hypothetical protein